MSLTPSRQMPNSPTPQSLTPNKQTPGNQRKKSQIRAKLQVRKIHVYVTLVTLVLGFMLAYSIQFTVNGMKQATLTADNEWDKKVAINDRIIYEKETNEALAAKLQKLRTEVDGKEKELSGRQLVSKQIVRELDALRMKAGVVPVTGPGVIVTLDDSKDARNMADVANGIVHDKNIRSVVNELFAAGAEGVSVNDQRFVTNSSVRCVGPTVILNETRLAPPFVIRAIGNKSTLATALEMPGGIVDILKQKTVMVKIAVSDKVDLPGYVGANQANKS